MLTVLLATKNGARTLPGVLEAYSRLQAPAGGWKLVVVDNGSTDATPEIASSYRDRLPLTCLSEREPGKNAALNAGLSLADGNLVVLTDDDAFPRADWLVRMRLAADARPSFSIFGGAVVPRWEVPPPEWLLRRVPGGPVFSLTDPSVPEGPTRSHSVFGPNMAIRSGIFDSGVRFDASIGPRGKRYPMGSETELVRRLMRQGHSAWHVKGAVVEHLIRDFQMQRRWVLERAIRFGKGQYRLAQAEAPPVTATWLGVPRYLVRAALSQVVLMLVACARLDGDGLFGAHWQLNYLRGQAMEARALRREAVTD